MSVTQQACDEVMDPPEQVITAELVANTISGIPLIGYARNALQAAGWDVTIVANRITIAKVIEAQLVSSNGNAWWQVYTADGTPPVWIVGTKVSS